MDDREENQAAENGAVIQVAHLTRKFAGRVAVQDLSFEVQRGEIVGLLGPNGAGKSTTMRMLAGFLPPSGGSVTVAGRDVQRDALEVRRRIGYLPENCPLYPEMRVDEYLRFRGALKGVRRGRLRARLDEVKTQCGLSDMGRRLIGQLSKGYRQRVGIADALIHEPELLILDEPTIGLDPNQIRQVRELIRSLADRHTILLSTHILSEVEVTCRRVLILNQGRLLVSESTEALQARVQGRARLLLEVQGPGHDVECELGSLPGVASIQWTPLGSWLRVTIEADEGVDPRPELAAAVARRGWALRELHMEPLHLEDIFAALTADGAGPKGAGL